MEKIRFGIVGIGMMGRMHATSLQRNPHAEVVAVCARTESKVKAFQEEFGVPYGYTNVDELVNNPEVDAIVVATGADAHKAPCLAACKAKKHIFCEKPLAKTIEDCEEIEKAVAENGSKCFTVGFMRRFDPSYAEAKEKIRAGAIGKPILFKGVSLDPSSVLEAHLEGVKKGIYVPWFIEMGSHDTDLARWFLEGDPVDSFATGDAYVCTGLADYNDYDNGFSLTKLKAKSSEPRARCVSTRYRARITSRSSPRTALWKSARRASLLAGAKRSRRRSTTSLTVYAPAASRRPPHTTVR